MDSDAESKINVEKKESAEKKRRNQIGSQIIPHDYLDGESFTSGNKLSLG